jgi:parallel beta-helix repeat protein
VRKGVLRNWGGKGVVAEACDGCVLERLRVTGSGSWGLVSGERGTVKACTVVNNPGGGVALSYHSLVTGCMSAGNGGNGFWSPNGATVRDCVAMNNNGDGFMTSDVSAITGCSSRDNASRGFVLGAGSTIIGCAATANGDTGISVALSSVVKDCSVKNNAGGGIEAGDACTVSGCSARQNGGPAGIRVGAACLVANNTVMEHSGGEQRGILAQSGASRIEGNNVCSNWWGIVTEAAGNFVFRNTAGGNTHGNYTNAPGNVVGDILNVSGGATVTSANPWANFSY